MMKSVTLLIVIYAVCIEAKYLDFSNVGLSTAGERVEGDELIFYAYRISPFYEDNKDTTFYTEILYKAPADVELITFARMERRGVSLIKYKIHHIFIYY